MNLTPERILSSYDEMVDMGMKALVEEELVHMARLSPPDRRSTLILLTPDGDGVWYGPGAPLGLRL
eukprot:COSAG02_NODE_7974_length_2763_cov_37.956456_2_plen_65_part_01